MASLDTSMLAQAKVKQADTMHINSFYFHTNQEQLFSVIAAKDHNASRAQSVILHGGGINTDHEKQFSLFVDPFIKQNKSILAFDFSGHGKSTGQLSKSSLKKKCDETRSIMEQHTDKSSPLTLCGASMSGYVAIKMLEVYKIDTLILFCPALYDKNAYDAPFDERFSTIIRKAESWKNTDVLELLQSFKGKLLIIIGDQDEVIPTGVIDLIDQHSANTSKKEIYRIPDCPHKINDWIIDQPDALIRLQNKIQEFIGKI